MENLLFLAKKTVGLFLHPVGMACFIWFLGLLVWARRPRGKAGPLLFLLAGLLLIFFSLPITGYHLLKPLEQGAGPYAKPENLIARGVKNIVVLGGGIRLGELSPSDQTGYVTTLRVMEGVRLWRKMSGSTLVFSGGEYNSEHSSAEKMVALAQELGVPPSNLALEKKSRDTEGQAQFLSQVLKEQPFALVTSASHMPRSLAIFEYYGLKPIPAPADFRTKELHAFNRFLPDIQGLRKSSTAAHEYFGLLWLKIKVLIQGMPE